MASSGDAGAAFLELALLLAFITLGIASSWFEIVFVSVIPFAE